MATISLQEVEVVQTLHGGPPVVVNFPEAAAQTFKRGELVNLVNGKVTEAAAADIYLGMALKDAAGVVDTNTQVVLATADVVFKANLTTSQVTAQADLGKSYGFAKVADKFHLSNTIVGANARALVIDHDSLDVIGDIQGRLYFIILSRFLQFRY